MAPPRAALYVRCCFTSRTRSWLPTRAELLYAPAPSWWPRNRPSSCVPSVVTILLCLCRLGITAVTGESHEHQRIPGRGVCFAVEAGLGAGLGLFILLSGRLVTSGAEVGTPWRLTSGPFHRWGKEPRTMSREAR
jgi:hypothetical protein